MNFSGAIFAVFTSETNNPSGRTWSTKWRTCWASLSSSGIKTDTRRLMRTDEQIDVSDELDQDALFFFCPSLYQTN